jgi:hypothetical protein
MHEHGTGTWRVVDRCRCEPPSSRPRVRSHPLGSPVPSLRPAGRSGSGPAAADRTPAGTTRPTAGRPARSGRRTEPPPTTDRIGSVVGGGSVPRPVRPETRPVWPAARKNPAGRALFARRLTLSNQAPRGARPLSGGGNKHARRSRLCSARPGTLILLQGETRRCDDSSSVWWPWP